MLTAREINLIPKGLFKGSIPNNVTWVYLDHVEKHHLDTLVHGYQMFLIGNEYVYYYSESKDLGFVIKLNEDGEVNIK
jgi:hypothetical protein